MATTLRRARLAWRATNAPTPSDPPTTTVARRTNASTIPSGAGTRRGVVTAASRRRSWRRAGHGGVDPAERPTGRRACGRPAAALGAVAEVIGELAASLPSSGTRARRPRGRARGRGSSSDRVRRVSRALVSTASPSARGPLRSSGTDSLPGAGEERPGRRLAAADRLGDLRGRSSRAPPSRPRRGRRAGERGPRRGAPGRSRVAGAGPRATRLAPVREPPEEPLRDRDPPAPRQHEVRRPRGRASHGRRPASRPACISRTSRRYASATSPPPPRARGRATGRTHAGRGRAPGTRRARPPRRPRRRDRDRAPSRAAGGGERAGYRRPSPYGATDARTWRRFRWDRCADSTRHLFRLQPEPASARPVAARRDVAYESPCASVRSVAPTFSASIPCSRDTPGTARPPGPSASMYHGHRSCLGRLRSRGPLEHSQALDVTGRIGRGIGRRCSGAQTLHQAGCEVRSDKVGHRAELTTPPAADRSDSAGGRQDGQVAPVADPATAIPTGSAIFPSAMSHLPARRGGPTRPTPPHVPDDGDDQRQAAARRPARLRLPTSRRRPPPGCAPSTVGLRSSATAATGQPCQPQDRSGNSELAHGHAEQPLIVDPIARRIQRRDPLRRGGREPIVVDGTVRFATRIRTSPPMIRTEPLPAQAGQSRDAHEVAVIARWAEEVRRQPPRPSRRARSPATRRPVITIPAASSIAVARRRRRGCIIARPAPRHLSSPPSAASAPRDFPVRRRRAAAAPDVWSQFAGDTPR